MDDVREARGHQTHGLDNKTAVDMLTFIVKTGVESGRNFGDGQLFGEKEARDAYQELFPEHTAQPKKA